MTFMAELSDDEKRTMRELGRGIADALTDDELADAAAQYGSFVMRLAPRIADHLDQGPTLYQGLELQKRKRAG